MLYVRFYAFSSTGCGNACEKDEEIPAKRVGQGPVFQRVFNGIGPQLSGLSN
jgi:hypothetical protein